MDDIAVKPKAKISDAEMERRRKIVRQADADNRIEGITRDPRTAPIFDAYIRGDIEVTEMVSRVKAMIGLG
jgi:hypothetical protein